MNIALFIIPLIKLNSSVMIVATLIIILAFLYFFLKVRQLTQKAKYYQTDEKTLHKFSAVFDSTPVGLAIYDANEVLIDINNAGMKIFGIADKEALIAAKIKLDDNPNFAKLKAKFSQSGQDSEILIEYDFNTINKKSGFATNRSGKRWLVCNIHKVLAANGQLDCIIISTTDVTHDINRNQKYERLYNETVLILKSLPVGVALFDRNSNQTYVNDTYMEIFGITDKKEFLNDSHNIYNNPLLSDELKKEIHNKEYLEFNVVADFSNKEIHDFYGSYHTDKKTLKVNFGKMLDKEGHNDISLVILSDITANEKSNQVINDMISNMALLIKAGQLIAWVLDLETGRREIIQGSKLLPEILSSDDYIKYFHPDDAVKLSNMMDSVRKGETEEVHNVVIRHKDPSKEGGYMYFELYWAVKKENGKPTKLACINRDVTAETIYRKQLELSKARTVLAFKEGEMTQYDFDVATGNFIVYYTDKLISRKSVVSMDEYVSYFHPDDAIKHAKIINDMKAGVDFSYSIGYRIRSKDTDDWQIMLLTNVPLEKDANGKVLVYTGLRRNNTRWHNLNLDLEKQNMLFKTVLDRMPCLFFMKDVNDNYRYVMANALFCNALGRSEDNVVGLTDYDMMKTSTEADRFRSDDVDAVDKGNKSVREETFWKEGRKVWHTSKSSINTTTGHRYLIGMSLDITNFDSTMNELRQARNKAERSDLLKSTFLANMSHEIRTPLNSIVGFADLIINSEDDKEKQEYGKIISNNSELLLKLINDILDMSKIESGFIGLKNASVNISELFDEYQKSFSKEIMKGIEFHCINPYKTCIIETDRNRLTQIVHNYMSNALKYTPKGHITLGYEHVDNGLRIYVEDTGIGISEDNQSRVFSRFEKFDSFAQGTGLGLSICKAIADAIGGKVGFQSQKDVGSTFWFWFPCNPILDEYHLPSHSSNSNTPEENNNGSKGKDTQVKILAAEDNDSNFVLLKAVLKDYDIDRASNGLDAVNMAKEYKYSLILMDMKMPIMGGLEATRKIRAFDNETPIIALTANAFDSDREDALYAGCTMYMAKPIKTHEIKKIIKEMI